MADVAVIYSRKSNISALATDVSFDDQEAACRDYAALHGYTVYKVYKESHSGADLLHRPLIWDAMDDIRQKRANVLLVRNYDRLARNPNHQGVIIVEVQEKSGGRVEAALDQQDPVLRGIMAVVAEAERVNSVARMERGKRNRVKRGQLMVGPHPKYGYRWADDVVGKRTAYVVDEKTGEVVRRIYTWYISGQTMQAIARQLDAEKAPTPSQYADMNGHRGRRKLGTHWTGAQVQRILNDACYAGKGVAYATQRVATENGKRVQVRRATDDANLVALPTAAWPPIVSEETFNAAQATLATQHATHDATGRPPHDKEAVWLRGHVFCGVCGARMDTERNRPDKRYSTRPTTYDYVCRRRPGNMTRHETACPAATTIRTHLLDEEAYDALRAILERRSDLERLLVERLGISKIYALASMVESYGKQLEARREEYETARKRARQTTDDALAADFLHDAETLKVEIVRLEADLQEAHTKLNNFNAGNVWIQSILDRIYLRPTVEDVRNMPYEERRVLLMATGMRVEVFPVGYRADGKRVVVTPISVDPSQELSQSSVGWR